MSEKTSEFKMNERWGLGLLVILAAIVRVLLFSGIYGHDNWAYLFYIQSFTISQTHEILHTPAEYA